MSRTTLCVLTAVGLALASVAAMIGRAAVLGDQVGMPAGRDAWKVTLLVRGRATAADARLLTVLPLDIGRQHAFNEACRSAEFAGKPPDPRQDQRLHVIWTGRPGLKPGPFRAYYRFYCTLHNEPPSTATSKLARAVYAAPPPGAHVQSEPRVESAHSEISETARALVEDLDDPRDQLNALFRFVDKEIATEPSAEGPGASAVECLREGGGDAGAKARLLVALCRNRGIPARLVTGLTLKRGHEQHAHVWAEAWVHGHWASACPVYHYLGRVPSTYLVFGYGDLAVARGRHVRDLSHSFLVEHVPQEKEAAAGSSYDLRRLLSRLSLFALPPAEQRLVEFLLLLPLAALIVCVYRNLIGLASFGTFAPALVGLAFRDLGSLPGILVFVAIVLLGWLMRRVLDRYHLLQVPRVAFLLSLVVVTLIGAIVTANSFDLPPTKYISLFPMVILTGMIERFWTLETEDGTASSFRTLLGTLTIATTISLVLGLRAVVQHMLRYPETLGLVMAAQLLLGRYTGYRLSELLRFRDLLQEA